MAAYTGVDNPELYFQTKLYTGDGSTPSITLDGDENMQPDLLWIKCRSDGSTSSSLQDAITGVDKNIKSDSTAAQSDDDFVTAFGSDGFTLSNSNEVNQDTRTFVAWCWKASNTTASDTNGSINSTVSVNATAGISIVSYTGAGQTPDTVGHSLGTIPKMMIIKNLVTAVNWAVYHEDIGNTHGLYLNDNDAKVDDVDLWYDTTPTSSLWTMSNSTKCNQGSRGHIAYCFTNVQGYSKFGTYTGNGNADGPFTYLGFLPSLIIIKRTDSTGNWVIEDNKRLGYNQANYHLYPNLANAESANYYIDQLSHGFKVRADSADINASGGTYIYAAFAAAPFANSKGVTNNAR